MRKVIAGTMLSLDGVMQAPGGPEEDPTSGFKYGGWMWHYSDEPTGQFIGKYLFGAPYDLLLGRKTYEIFAAYWPYQEGPIAKAFNAVRKYVATSSSEPLTWKNSVVLHDPAADVARLKKEDGPNLLLQGSSVLIQTLLAKDLIDEFHLLVCPLVLGKGKKLFGEGAKPIGLKLVDTKVSTTGVTMSSYERGGEIKTGSFASDKPSAAEIARQEKMKREG